MSEYEFCPMNHNQVCCQNGYPFFTAGHYAGPSACDCSSCFCIRVKIAMIKKLTEYDQEIPQPHTLIIIIVILKVSKGAKIRSRYNQVPHPTQDTNGKVTNSQ